MEPSELGAFMNLVIGIAAFTVGLVKSFFPEAIPIGFSPMALIWFGSYCVANHKISKLKKELSDLKSTKSVV